MSTSPRIRRQAHATACGSSAGDRLGHGTSEYEEGRSGSLVLPQTASNELLKSLAFTVSHWFHPPPGWRDCLLDRLPLLFSPVLIRLANGSSGKTKVGPNDV